MVPDWIKNFNISEAKWEALIEAAHTQGTSPLALAIEQTLLSEEALLDFEREKSKLPSLKSIFFDGEPPVELWAGYNLEQCFAAGCLPVACWDEKVYWAKLTGENVTLESVPSDVMWVLAPWSGLIKWFEKWKSMQSADESDPPIGLEEKLAGSVSSFDFSAIRVLDGKPQAPPPAQRPLPQLNKPVMGMRPPAMPPVPQYTAFENTVTDKVPPLPNAAGEIKPVSIENLSDRLRTAASQEELAAVLLGGWQNYFEKMMVLLIHGDTLMIWRWTGQWLGNFKQGQTIHLGAPSIFKISFDTSKPYHGYVSPGKTNDEFFNLANGGKYPEHVTIMPVIAEGVCVAMLCGACSIETGKSLILNRLEDQTKLFAQSLLKFGPPVKKAG